MCEEGAPVFTTVGDVDMIAVLQKSKRSASDTAVGDTLLLYPRYTVVLPAIHTIGRR